MKPIDLELEILNSLADDGENIDTIKGMLMSLANINVDETRIIESLTILLNNDLIYIRYPDNAQPNNFFQAVGEKKYDFWFEMTDKGIEKWKASEEYFMEEES